MSRLIKFLTKNKKLIVFLFFLAYFLNLLLLLMGWNWFATQKGPLLYNIGVVYGRLAVIFYSITLLPGIIRRFQIKESVLYQTQTILMLFRRQIGILVFFTVLIHYMFLRGFRVLSFGLPSILPTFEIVGFIAFQLMFLLFITSNDWSVSKLKKWWIYLHRTTYVIVFLIFLHILLAEFSLQRTNKIFLITAFSVLFLEWASLIYSYLIKKSKI
ncbi:MAG: hypothetical protein KatS3mg090_0933 [Patescibacteria group bacterium]|nr:MAG: hypothetical protein KatS3mg090_0933 [Patescibacteria group bacterium]